MPERTDIDRLIAARPDILSRTEDVADAAAEDRILRRILTSGAGAAPATVPPARPRRAAGRPAGFRSAPAALGLAAAGLAAAMVLAVIAMLPAGRPAGHRPHVQLAAWTVTKLADGNVRVHFNQLRHPGALQRRLRAEGVPASVISLSQHNPCRKYPASMALLNKVFPGSYRQKPPPSVIVIRPSALPRHTGVQLAADFGHRSGAVAAPIVVHGSQQCTGS